MTKTKIIDGLNAIVRYRKDKFTLLPDSAIEACKGAIRALGAYEPPEPCVKVGGRDVKKWRVKEFFAKIDEELNEFKEAALDFTDMGLDTIIRENEPPKSSHYDCSDAKSLAREAADVITVITSMLEALGIDADMRAKAQKSVNEKNRIRGRL